MSFLPMSGDKPLTFWQQLALVAVPALIGSAVPTIVDHMLRSKPEEKKTNDEKK